MLFKSTLLAAAVITATSFALDPALAVDSNVAIQDPITGTTARVDLGRRQHVFDERGVADKLQSQFVRFWGGLNTSCGPVATPPAGRSMVIKSIFVNVFENGTSGGGHLVAIRVGSSCGGSNVTFVNPNGVGMVPLNFEPGIVVPAGQHLWAFVGGDVDGEIAGTGYTVPYAWAPSSISVSSQDDQEIQQQPSARLGNGD